MINKYAEKVFKQVLEVKQVMALCHRPQQMVQQSLATREIVALAIKLLIISSQILVELLQQAIPGTWKFTVHSIFNLCKTLQEVLKDMN